MGLGFFCHPPNAFQFRLYHAYDEICIFSGSKFRKKRRQKYFFGPYIFGCFHYSPYIFIMFHIMTPVFFYNVHFCTSFLYFIFIMFLFFNTFLSQLIIIIIFLNLLIKYYMSKKSRTETPPKYQIIKKFDYIN